MEIESKSLIWHEGLEDWKEAESFEELREIFELRPPTIDFILNEEGISEELDSTNRNQQKFNYKPQKMFSNPFSFDGRIRRTEYGISLFLIFISLVIVVIILESNKFPVIALSYIPIYWFLWAQGAKRCHDLGNNGWWQFIPFYVFILIFQKGDLLINKYGKDPRY